MLVLLCALAMDEAMAQMNVRMNRQVSFGDAIPAGNYSGIAHIRDNLYAVVSDKSEQDGFFVFKIDVDSVSGIIHDVANMGFVATGVANRDAEGVAFVPERHTVLIVGERDGRIAEYDSVGVSTGRELQLDKASSAFGYESLTYNATTRRLWTCTENVYADANALTSADTASVVILRAFDAELNAVASYPYRLDFPQMRKKFKHYAHGVSELLALDDGSLLVLEREFHVPTNALGASVVCKIYRVVPDADELMQSKVVDDDDNYAYEEGMLSKRLVCEWKTKLTLFGRSLANYEGMCLGPRLVDGSQTIVLVSDSQNREGGVLRDWFKTIVIENKPTDETITTEYDEVEPDSVEHNGRE